MADYVIETMNLTRQFDRGITAVNDVSLHVERGVVYGLIGRNGAGKTTLLRLLMGILHPTSGKAVVFGQAMENAPCSLRAKVSYVSQSLNIYKWMSPAELCAFMAPLYPTWDMDYARRLSETFDLLWEQPITQMSGGQQQKAAILAALATRAEVLILDEPAAGLDPIARRQLIDEMIDAISERQESTILFSTHIISDLERIADTIGFMDQGKIIKQHTMNELQAAYKRIQIIFDGDSAPSDFSLTGMIHSQVTGAVLNALVKFDSEEAMEELSHQPGMRVQIFPINLEDLFIELLGKDKNNKTTEDRNDE